jgi:hypothetical protein
MFVHVFGTWYKVPGAWEFGRPPGRPIGASGGADAPPGIELSFVYGRAGTVARCCRTGKGALEILPQDLYSEKIPIRIYLSSISTSIIHKDA